jgi:Fe-S cluster assembly iron-binding protein IscA
MLLGPEDTDEMALETNGVTLRMDRLPASRADDARIDLARSRGGSAFHVGLPNALCSPHG